MNKSIRRTFWIFMMIFLVVSCVLPACKAKSCDTANNIDGDEGGAKRRKKNLGLFSKKEQRRKKWR